MKREQVEGLTTLRGVIEMSRLLRSNLPGRYGFANIVDDLLTAQFG